MEGKPAQVLETPQHPEREPDRRPTTEGITSYAATVTDLLKDGATPGDVTAQFAVSLHPGDWAAIRESATSQVKQKGGWKARITLRAIIHGHCTWHSSWAL